MSRIDLFIMPYSKIDWKNHDEFNVAVTFGDIPLICLQKIPKEAYNFIEEKAEILIEHETLHIILSRLEKEASSYLDNIHDLEGWKF